jgi:hypothetical protein
LYKDRVLTCGKARSMLGVNKPIPGGRGPAAEGRDASQGLDRLELRRSPSA